MDKLVATPLFGLTMCVLAYLAAQWLNRRFKSPLTNPLFVSIFLLVVFLLLTGLPYESINGGGRTLTMLLVPATAGLAVVIYRQRAVLGQALLPILAGCTAGSVVSVSSLLVLGRIFQVDYVLIGSLLAKSVTTPIAVSLSESVGGLLPLTTAAVILTGMIGAAFAQLFIRLLRLREPLAQGVAIGTSSHALGTSKAVEIGQVQGAVSGISIGVSGLITTFLFLFL